MNSIEDRLDTLESVVDEQQAQIETHKETIAAQQETIDAQRERLAAVENDGGVSMPISRRGAIAAGGALGLLGLGAGTASAQGSGQIGTSDTPVETLYTQKLSGGLTNGSEIQDLVGFGLEIYETDSRLDVDWSDADELNEDGRLLRPELWLKSIGGDNSPPSIVPDDIDQVTIPNIRNVVEIMSVDEGNDSLNINFGGDTLKLNNPKSGINSLAGIADSISVNIDGTTYYVPLYNLD